MSHAPFHHRRRVQFAETDMAGVVHFSSFFRMMEEAEHEMFRSVGLSVVMHVDGREIGWPRVAATCEYAAPLRFEDLVDIRITITKLSGKSLSYEARFGVGDREVAAGRVTTVCVESSDGEMRAIPIPDAIREKLARFVVARGV